MWETRVQILGREDLLEKEMATHSSILAWRIPWTEEPGRLQSMESQTERLHFHFHFHAFIFQKIHMRKTWKSLSCVLLFVTPWTVAHQAPPSVGFSRQEYWNGLTFPSQKSTFSLIGLLVPFTKSPTPNSLYPPTSVHSKCWHKLETHSEPYCRSGASLERSLPHR